MPAEFPYPTYYYGSQYSRFGTPPSPGGGYNPRSSVLGSWNFLSGPQKPFMGGQQQQAPAPTMPAASYPNLDIANDPTLARIKALGEQSVSEAEAEAERQRIQVALGYGDPSLAASLHLNKDIQTKAANNPFSVLKELSRGYKRRDVFDINRPMSDQSNLFYSSERGRQLALSGEQYLRDRNTAWMSVQEKLAAISNMILQAKLQAMANNIAADQQAYNNAVKGLG